MDTDGQRHGLVHTNRGSDPQNTLCYPRHLIIYLAVWLGNITDWQWSEPYLQHYHRPGDHVVSLKHSCLPHPVTVIGKHPKEAKHQAEQTWTHTDTHTLQSQKEVRMGARPLYEHHTSYEANGEVPMEGQTEIKGSV